MTFIETRGNDGKKPYEVTFSQAILNPGASYGGLYVPSELPKIDETFLKNHLHSSYVRLCKALMRHFDIDIEEDDLDEALRRYERFDDKNRPVPVEPLADGCYVSELYHGPTRSFKDLALQPFGFLLSRLAQKRHESYLIMAATSGDTGPATLETFKGQSNVRVVCLYPDGGTSDVQRLQMVTEEGSNIKVLGIHGNFDDAQSALKTLLASETFRDVLDAHNVKLSAANSVNFGRIIFQIVYHVYGYLQLVRKGVVAMGDPVNLIIPSGNFGNALGGYYAKKMGLPVKKILIASNINNILTSLINDGCYDLADRVLMKTTSPAMDILKSSNVERVLFDKYGEQRTKQLMDQLQTEGRYQLTPEELELLREDFDADYCSDEEGMALIAKYAKMGYLMDPHTATCLKLYEKMEKGGVPCLIASTAEWTKFSPTVAEALGSGFEQDIQALQWISACKDAPIVPVIADLFDKRIVHNEVVENRAIEEMILQFILS